jgi:hypothetical protein
MEAILARTPLRRMLRRALRSPAKQTRRNLPLWFLVAVILSLALLLPKLMQTALVRDNAQALIRLEEHLTSHLQMGQLVFVWASHKPLDTYTLEVIKNHTSGGRRAVFLCGSRGCMHEVEHHREAHAVTPIRLQIEELLEDSPFSHYLRTLPMLRLHLGPAFPTHFHQFCSYAALWRYGGMYVDLDPQPASGLSRAGCCGSILDFKTPPGSRRFSKRSGILKRVLLDLIKVAEAISKNEASRPEHPELLGEWRDEVIPSEPVIEVPFDFPMTQHYGIMQSDISSAGSDSPDISEEIIGLSALQFLPHVDTFVDKISGKLSGPCLQEQRKLKIDNNYSRVTFVADGWNVARAEFWPPTRQYNPILLSLPWDPLIRDKLSAVDPGFDYLKKHGPVGLQSSYEPAKLDEAGVQAYISASASLLRKQYVRGSGHDGTTYAIDVSPEVLSAMVPEHVLKTTVIIDAEALAGSSNRSSRYLAADTLLEKLSRARLVITSKMQWALPSAGMNIPVLFLKMKRSEGMTVDDLYMQLFHTIVVDPSLHITPQLKTFSWDSPLPNPNKNILNRLRASIWLHLRQDTAILETARTFGIIPLPKKDSGGKLKFFQIYTTSTMTMRNRRSLESILYHHPDSCVTLYGNSLPIEEILFYLELGYDVRIVPYSLRGMLEDAIGSKSSRMNMYVQAFLRRMPWISKGDFWYSHETDLIRLLILYKQGGVYLDTDMLILRPVTMLRNSLAWETEDRTSLNGALLAFEAENEFIFECIKEFIVYYSRDKWAENGPLLLTRVAIRGTWACKNKDPEAVHQTDCHVSLLSRPYFYPIEWQWVENTCFLDNNPQSSSALLGYINSVSYAIHLNNKMTGHHSRTMPGTLCRVILNKYCLSCPAVL